MNNQNIVKQRKDIGLLQKQVAIELGISNSYLKKMESGAVPIYKPMQAKFSALFKGR